MRSLAVCRCEIRRGTDFLRKIIFSTLARIILYMPLSVHIVTDKPQDFKQGYLIAKLACHWQRAGYEITHGPVSSIDTDLAILHINQTRISQEVLPDNPCNSPFLNGNVLDISKSSFSTLRVFPDDSWDGLVIVKSDLNCFGKPEWRNSESGFFAKNRRRLAKRAWPLARRLPPERYPVLKSLKKVPGWVWRNPEIIVERFMPEREQGLYCLRGWVFFGKCGYTYKLYSTDPMVKTGTMMKYEFLNEPPVELVDFRMKNGFDFGKFDFVEIDGAPILLDINKTPYIVSDANTPRLKYLAEGLNEFLESC